MDFVIPHYNKIKDNLDMDKILEFRVEARNNLFTREELGKGRHTHKPFKGDYKFIRNWEIAMDDIIEVESIPLSEGVLDLKMSYTHRRSENIFYRIKALLYGYVHYARAGR